jgi:hypothetical protein
MKAHGAPSSASYVNWRGRTVRRIREEAALHDALQSHIERAASELLRMPPAGVHAKLRELVNRDVAAGRLTLSP